jgi:CheY-like chemotaxis protein
LATLRRLGAMDDLFKDFLTETGAQLAIVDQQIGRFVRDSSNARLVAPIAALFRGINGACGLLDLPRLERIAGGAELQIVRLRQGDAASVGHILAAIDNVRTILQSVAATGHEPEADAGAPAPNAEAPPTAARADATITAIIVSIDGESFALPCDCVEDIATPPPGAHSDVGPVVDLGAVLDGRPARAREVALRLRIGAKSVTALADSATDIGAIVVTPLPAPLRRRSICSGATLLHDGVVALVLDPAGILAALDRASVARPDPTSATPNADPSVRPAAPAKASPGAVLIVDSEQCSRNLFARAFGAAGRPVLAAATMIAADRILRGEETIAMVLIALDPPVPDDDVRALAGLARSRRSLTIIGLSANRGDSARMRALGLDGAIGKFDPPALLALAPTRVHAGEPA